MASKFIHAKRLVNPFDEFEDVYIQVDGYKISRVAFTNPGVTPTIECDLVIPGCIDPHVHVREPGATQKEDWLTVGEAAVNGGVTYLFDMPNNPDLTLGRFAVEKKEDLARKCCVNYGLYMGLTADPVQIRTAISVAKLNPKVIGFKLYAGKTTGELSVVDVNGQKNVWNALTDNNYKGVVVVHCEKEKFLKPELWNPDKPESHCDARPPEAEMQSLEDQIVLAKGAGFKGHIHIAHTSLPETVDRVNELKGEGMRISCGVTPHHLFFTRDDMKKKGMFLKMNPPLRSAKRVVSLRKRLKAGKVDLIETDHAPHTVPEKTSSFPSGVPLLDTYSGFLGWLNKDLGVSWKDIVRLTSSNITKIWGLKEREVRTGSLANLSCFNNEVWEVSKNDLRTKCGWSPFEGYKLPVKTAATVVNGTILKP